jgi:hypothetical protein
MMDYKRVGSREIVVVLSEKSLFFCQRCDLGAQTSVLGFEDGQLVVGLLGLEFPLLAALGDIGHAVLEPLD